MPSEPRTLIHGLRKIQSEKPNNEAFISYNDKPGRQAITLKEFYTLCKRFAYVLKNECGVKPGDYVCTTLPISIETAVATFGIVVAGGVPVSLDITFKNGEGLIQCLEKLKPRLNLILIRNQDDDNVLNFFKSGLKFSGMQDECDLATLTWPRLPHLTKAYLAKRGGDNDFLSKLRRVTGEYECESIDQKSSAFMHYTTGTVTDYLRMTEMTHGNAVDYCQSLRCQLIKPFTKQLYINGWYWVSGMPFDILKGITRCIPDNWEPSTNVSKLLYRMIRFEEIRYADLPPAYLEEMREYWKADFPDGKPILDLLTILGMPITRKMLQRFQGMTHTFNLIYGSHECGANHSHILPSSNVDQFTDFDCGPPMPGVQTKVVDENGKPVAKGEKGRLLLKTPGMFVGYPGQPERTAAKFNSDGWYVTNDRACYDEISGHLKVGGRIDSLILHGEFMIYPKWVEDMVSPHPSVQQVISVPVADDVLFHAVGICVITTPGHQNITRADVTKYLQKHLFEDKVFIFDVDHILFFDEFPLKQDGQVDRSRLFDIVHEKMAARK